MTEFAEFVEIPASEIQTGDVIESHDGNEHTVLRVIRGAMFVEVVVDTGERVYQAPITDPVRVRG